MNKLIIVLVFVCGTLMVQRGEAKPSYENCIKNNAETIGKAKISSELMELVDEARQYYGKEAPKDIGSRPMPKACIEIETQIEKTSQCQEEGKEYSYAKVLADEFEASAQVKNVVEAYYVCQAGRLAGAQLEEDGLFHLYQ